ncbi:response regulator [Phnomibacter ginsenosidimutans]|uniref:Phosphate regulon transcriptional regulatory protein PhoB n=1 Tax=Phnomibacter ginsenosidimutans TaxID=2676868 RepID=A0A6I6G6W0_9BACT|nr:response regulator [Phnomibacter ginsenosidimutans]QGW27183.1 response regulator [Phnomibacter ginsenosidimutans]
MDTKGTILIADDEADILEIIGYNLSREGYKVLEAKDGNQALDLARQHHPDLIILDIMMPYKSGIEVCNILRTQQEFKETLIVMLTALSDEGSHIKGLDSGADDYLSKPISPKVLLSRVNALFRRIQKDSGQKVLSMGDMTIDPVRFVVTRSGKDIVLAKKEFELLYLLAAKPGRVFLRNEILSNVWGTDVIVGDRTIDVHIRKIRQKLDVDCITTVKGVGYKFDPQ